MSIGLESVGVSPIGLLSSEAVAAGTDVSCQLGTLSLSGLAATLGVTTSVESTTADISLSGLSASITIGAMIDCTVATSSIAGLSATVQSETTVSSSVATLSATGLSASVVFGTITVTSPVIFQTFQRNVSNQANIAITGTYTGSPTSIEASFNGGAYATIVASPTGGTFSGSLSSQTMGQGTLTVRFTNDTSVSSVIQKVKIGDIYIVFGQSNHVGQAPNYVAPSTVNGNASEWGVDGSWRELLETSADRFSTRANGVQCSAMNQLVVDGQGSYFGALATKIMAVGVPVAFVPCAVGSSSIAAWAPGASHTNPATLYGSAVTRSQSVGDFKAALWWQGEQDSVSGTSYATYVSALDSLITNWHTDTGKPVVVSLINRTSAGTLANVQAIQNAQLYVGRSNAHAIPGANNDQLWTTGGVHYQTANDINAIADKAFAVLSAQFYGGTVVTCAVATATMTGLQAGINNSQVTCSVGTLTATGLSASIVQATTMTCTVGSSYIQGYSAAVNNGIYSLLTLQARRRRRK